jgi:hypothetical protein
MSDEKVYRTRSGKILTEADIEELAAEAERGYDVNRLKPMQVSRGEYGDPSAPDSPGPDNPTVRGHARDLPSLAVEGGKVTTVEGGYQDAPEKPPLPLGGLEALAREAERLADEIGMNLPEAADHLNRAAALLREEDA